MKYKPPYQITSQHLKQLQDISLLIGEANALNLNKPSTKLRRQNRIKSIHSSLAIEGNSLTLNQVTAILNEQRIIGPIKDILEVQNAIATYSKLSTFNPYQKSDLLKAHKLLMSGILASAGRYRSGAIGIIKGNNVEHMAPPAHLVTRLVKQLLGYVKTSTDLTLIKACVFHYEFEFIHPFEDGNGRMGRLWQTLILIQEFPLFEYLPIEHMIKNHQEGYYKSLGESDKLGQSTPFISFMLSRIKETLEELLSISNIPDDYDSRINIAKDHFRSSEFSRIDYMKVHKKISSATASRDLRKAVDIQTLKRIGERNKTRYRFTK